MKKHILFIGAHADDLELDMGGTILKYHDLGYTVTSVMMTNNMSGGCAWLDENGKIQSRHPEPEEEMLIRKGEAEKAAKVYGGKVIHIDCPQRHYFHADDSKIELDYGSERPACIKPGLPPVLFVHEHKEIIDKIVQIILDEDPEVIATLQVAGYNLEHTATGYCAAYARAKARKQGYDGTLLLSMGPAPSGVVPFYNRYDTFINTTGYFQKKVELCGIHTSQKPAPERLDFRDFIEGSRCGCETAEPFLVDLPQWKSGIFTAELVKNRIYCMEHYQKMFF